MFREEASTEERDTLRKEVKAWIKTRQLEGVRLCALSNHRIVDGGLLCATCERDRLESASLTRIARGEGLTHSNAERYSQENFVLDLFVFCAREEDKGLGHYSFRIRRGRAFSEIVSQITESINKENA